MYSIVSTFNSGGYGNQLSSKNQRSSLFYFHKNSIPKISHSLSFYFQKIASYIFLLPKNSGGYGKTFGEKKTRLLGGNIFYLLKNGTPPSFVKTFDLISGTSVRDTVGLILVRKGLKCFNFYSIIINYYSIDEVDALHHTKKARLFLFSNDISNRKEKSPHNFLEG